MYKKDLINKIQKETGIEKKIIEKVYNSMIKVIKENLFFGVDVVLKEFVSFKITTAKGGVRRNPKTGEKLLIKKHYKINISIPRSWKDMMKKKPVY